MPAGGHYSEPASAPTKRTSPKITSTNVARTPAKPPFNRGERSGELPSIQTRIPVASIFHYINRCFVAGMVRGNDDVPVCLVHYRNIGWAAAFVDDFSFEFTVHILNIEQVAVFASDAANKTRDTSEHRPNQCMGEIYFMRIFINRFITGFRLFVDFDAVAMERLDRYHFLRAVRVDVEIGQFRLLECPKSARFPILYQQKASL